MQWFFTAFFCFLFFCSLRPMGRMNLMLGHNWCVRMRLGASGTQPSATLGSSYLIETHCGKVLGCQNALD